MTLPAHLHSGAPRSGATRRQAEQCREDAAQAQILEATEWAYKTFSRSGADSLALFARARLLGRLRALQVLARELGGVKLAFLISVLFALLQRTLQGQRCENHEAGVAQRTRPRITRPNVHAGVEPQLTASF